MAYDDLDALLEHIWNYLEAAVIDRANAMTTPALATCGPDGPNVRTVALRKASRRQRALLFHTDVRSSKVAELEANPRAVWMGWDPKSSEQIQLCGQTSIHRDDDLADKLWEGLPDDEQAFYFKPKTPGAPSDVPVSGIRRGEVDEETARHNFAAVRTLVDEIRWLYLGRSVDEERQARFEWDGEQFRGQWRVP
jgi:general stress protein 26